MNKILISLLLAFSMIDLSLGEWIEFNQDENAQIFYNENSIKKIDDNKLSMNILFNHLNDEEYKSSIVVGISNCEKRFFKIQMSHIYSESMGK